MESTKALLTPKEVCYPEARNEVEATAIRKLKESVDFTYATTFREQVGIACSFLRTDECRISYSRLATMFNVNKGSIKDQESKYRFGVLSDGRPPSFSKAELDAIYDYIDNALNNNCVTFDEISDFVYLKFQKDVLKDTLRHVIRNEFGDDFKTVIGLPLDSKRVDVNPEEKDQYFKQLEFEVQRTHPYFIFNLDEVGVQDFVDAQEQHVLVRSSYEKPTAYYSVERAGKRITALFCISTNADWIPPLIVTNRSTVDSEIHTLIPPDKYMIKQQSKGFLNTINFKHWFEDVFLQMLQWKRKKYNYNGPVLLLMDGFISHQQITELIPLAEYNINVLFIVAHASDQLQALDLGIFANQKRQISRIKNEKVLSSQTNRIVKLIDGLWKAASPKNVTAAFRSAGILMTCHMTNGVPMVYAGVRRGAARAVRHYEQSVLERIVESQLELSESQQLAKNKLTLNEIHENSFRIKI